MSGGGGGKPLLDCKGLVGTTAAETTAGVTAGAAFLTTPTGTALDLAGFGEGLAAALTATFGIGLAAGFAEVLAEGLASAFTGVLAGVLAEALALTGVALTAGFLAANLLLPKGLDTFLAAGLTTALGPDLGLAATFAAALTAGFLTTALAGFAIVFAVDAGLLAA